MNLVAAWSSRPIFVSSTFRDMQAERDHLIRHVFPALEEWLATRHRHLEWVDLRVGVAGADDEVQREVMVLKVCLDEARRARPFVLGLLGDRYGWVPPTARLAAAMNEVGFQAPAQDRSVTDLEIDFGVLADPATCRRSLFFFRAPLPYGDMPPETAAAYSEHHAADGLGAGRAANLAQLKARLRQALPGRCIDYVATWDPATQRVADLDGWGKMVTQRLRAALEEELAEAPAAEPSTSSEVEELALHALVEQHSRNFVGRSDTLRAALDIASSPASDAGPWGVCITGGSGAGKTAVFAALCRQFAERQVFTLAHSPVISAWGGSIARMLQRFFVAFLAHADGGVHLFRYTPDGNIMERERELCDKALAAQATEDALYALFGFLLHRMAERRRVVILLDALDRMEPLAVLRFLAWMAEHRLPNVVLLATSAPDETSAHLAAQPGIVQHELPPLGAADARELVGGICARYHRVFPASVLHALLSERGPGAAPWVSPLWLVIATEQLNLLDADDFAAATLRHGGREDERIEALMRERIEAMPPEVRGMYRGVIARAEEVYGVPLVAALIGMMAVGRAGWRERDFRTVMPRLSGEAWNELRFASLRRMFRGHLHCCPPLDRWDVQHEQLKITGLEHMRDAGLTAIAVHSALADHLLEVAPEDPLRIDEVMFHLLAAQDWRRAARYLGSLPPDDAGARGAHAVMAGLVRGSPTDMPTQGADTLTRLLGADGIDMTTLLRVAGHLLQVHYETQGRCSLASEAALLGGVDEALGRVVDRQPADGEVLRLHGRCLTWLGHLRKDQGDLQGSLAYLRRADEMHQRVLQQSPKGAADEGGGPNLGIGDALLAQGDLDGALAVYGHPAHASSSAARGRIGHVLRARGDLAGAIEHYLAGIEMLKRDLQAQPHNDSMIMNLGIAMSAVGSTFVMMRETGRALTFYGQAEQVLAGVAARNPREPRVRFQWALMHYRIGQAQQGEGDGHAAWKSYDHGSKILDDVLAHHPDNADYRYHRVLFELSLGDMQLAHADVDGARRRWKDARRTLAELLQASPGHQGLQDAREAFEERLQTTGRGGS